MKLRLNLARVVRALSAFLVRSAASQPRQQTQSLGAYDVAPTFVQPLMSKRKLSAMDFFSRHSQPSAEPATLISFYEDDSSDSRGRHLADILRWGVNRLESSHDYIQILFPLPERSGVNDRAPIIDRRVFEAFRGRSELRDKLRDAFKKMLWFYGFELCTGEDGKLVVNKGHNYQVHCETWLTRFDHNHLRITRIIRCLRVLGLEDEAVAFYHTISSATIVSSRSRMYWERAAHRPLNIRPDVDEEDIDDVDRFGPQFLREFEQARRERERKQLARSEGTTADEDGQAKDNQSDEITQNRSAMEQMDDQVKKQEGPLATASDAAKQTDGLKGGCGSNQTGSAKEDEAVEESLDTKSVSAKQ